MKIKRKTFAEIRDSLAWCIYYTRAWEKYINKNPNPATSEKFREKIKKADDILNGINKLLY